MPRYRVDENYYLYKKGKNIMNSLKNMYFKSCAVITVLALTPATVKAQESDLIGVSATVSQNLESLETVIATVCYIAGLAFGIAGLLKLKEYMDKPGQGAGLKEPMGRLLVAALLIALPTLLDIITGSSTGTGTNIDVGSVAIG